MGRRHQRTLGCLVVSVLAGSALSALSACGTSADQRGELAALTTTGTPLVPATPGTGAQDLGAFSASGRVSVAVSCVGPGSVHVVLREIDLDVDAPCVPSVSDSGGSQSATARVALPRTTAFTVRVTGRSSTRWLVAVSDDGAQAAA